MTNKNIIPKEEIFQEGEIFVKEKKEWKWKLDYKSSPLKCENTFNHTYADKFEREDNLLSYIGDFFMEIIYICSPILIFLGVAYLMFKFLG